MTLLTRWRRARRAPGAIDARELARSLPEAELLASAEAYFAALPAGSEQARKPFSSTAEAPDTMRKLGLVLQAAQLFPGADVLEFGCGTGWLTLGLARMGCRATGVDIAPSAVRLAEAEAGRTALPAGASARFLAYDGHRLPLDDASVDRIVCFDAFHHVKDQGAAIGEFARVLRPGGLAALVEPSPLHSLSVQSQQEMRRFRVIEDDIRMEEIAVHAAAAGLSPPHMLVQFQQPVRLSLAEYQGGWSWSGLSFIGRMRLWLRLARSLNTTQCFVLAKGEAAVDSRSGGALGGALVVRSAQRLDDRMVLEVVARNTGRARWLTEGDGIGVVRLGVQRETGAGVDVDFRRIALPAGGVGPGGEVVLQFDAEVPPGTLALRLDLVSEHVAWFEVPVTL